MRHVVRVSFPKAEMFERFQGYVSCSFFFFFFLDEAIYFTVHRLIRLSFPTKMYSDAEKWLV